MEEKRVRTSDSLLTCANLLPVFIGKSKYSFVLDTNIEGCGEICKMAKIQFFI